MAVYRFRVKADWDPTSLWRDIRVGGERSLDKFQSTINRSMGLDQDHLWFFGPEEDFWNSEITYVRPGSAERDGFFGGPREIDAGEVTVFEMVQQLGLDERDRICYLFDYGDEWRFYAILKEIDPDGDAKEEPIVVNEKGDKIDQYAQHDEYW